MHVVYSKKKDELKGSSFSNIYEQYANEAAFLWILRSIAIKEPHNNQYDILQFEQRIDAQLNGLMTSMKLGWQVCEDALELQEPGEVFTALIVAMRSHDFTKIKTAVDVGLTSDSATKGLVSALGWLPADIVNTWIERFLNGKDMRHKYLGVAACSIRRVDLGDSLVSILKRDDCMSDHKLYSRALRLVGELRRQDCMPYINSAMNNDNPDICFWANWSSILLGTQQSVKNLKSYVFNQNRLQEQAIQVAFRVLAIDTAREWISELSTNSKNIRVVIKATAVLGDPHAVNWLINKMANPLYAKLAGESFTFITGVDLNKNELSIKEPDDYPVIPNDDIDDDLVALDEDENLPFPDINKVTSIWQKYGQKFVVGKRYFMGQLITPELLKDYLKNGMQRQRHAAAMELALNEKGLPLVNTHGKVLG